MTLECSRPVVRREAKDINELAACGMRGGSRQSVRDSEICCLMQSLALRTSMGEVEVQYDANSVRGT